MWLGVDLLYGLRGLVWLGVTRGVGVATELLGGLFWLGVTREVFKYGFFGKGVPCALFFGKGLRGVEAAAADRFFDDGIRYILVV